MPASAARARARGPCLSLAVGALLAALTLLGAAAASGGVVHTGDARRSAGSYEVVRPANGIQEPATAEPVPDLDAFTVEAARAKLPRRYTGRTARNQPIDRLYFLHASNIIEMNRVWAKRAPERPTCIVLGRGSYSLESVWRQIDDPAVLSRGGDGSYLLKRPIYIAPTATLAVSGGTTLRLSIGDGTFIYSNGTLLVVDSTVAAWDAEKNIPAHHEALEKKTALFYARQQPRPYILASEGSKTFLAGSTFTGLGYKGTSGTFGISFALSAGGGRLGDFVERLARPTGWLIGNRIVDLFFGYYSNDAEDVAIVGNLFSNNVVYAIDPHDYSKRLIVARNVVQGSSFAHGIIFSRGVRDSWVVENLTIANGGSGIMMDRSSTDNLIADNLVVGNDGDGIAIFESDRSMLRDNAVIRNRRNGLLIRNSTDVHVQGNTISRNGRSGIEIASADISDLETRDFSLDPFHQLASAHVQRNSFEDNVRSAVAMRDADLLALHANRYPGSGPLYFDGDLQPHSRELLAAELAGTSPVLVRRAKRAANAAIARATPERPASPPRNPNPLLEEHARRGVPVAMLGLARHYIRERDDARSWRRGIYWYGRAIRHARVSAMSELGVALVSGVGRNATERQEGLVLLSMAAQLGDLRARGDLELLPDMLATPRRELDAARHEAARRLSARKLWNAEVFPDLDVRLDREEALEASRRIEHLMRERRTHKPPRPPRLDRERRKRYERRVEEKNTALTRLNERLREESLADERAQGERRAHLDRVDRRERAAELRTKAYMPDERRALEARVTHLLQAVNRHRALDDPLHLEAVMLPPRTVGE